MESHIIDLHMLLWAGLETVFLEYVSQNLKKIRIASKLLV